MPNLPLDGPSEQLLAEGTRGSCRYLIVGFGGPVFVDEPRAVQGRAGSFDESEPGGFVVDVDDESAVL